MKGGKQLRRISIGSAQVFDIQNTDTTLNEYHVRPEDIVSVCVYEGGTYVYYLSES